MGMGLEDLKRAVYDKLGSAEAAMEAMDKDGDGVISEDEFVAELKKAGFGEKEAKEMYKNLAEADADGDGKVSEKEYMEACAAKGTAKAQCEELWAAADADGDGVASAEDLERVREEAKAAAKDFGEADVDGDGE